MSAIGPMCRIYERFSFSHWGLVTLPIFTAPDWFVMGMTDLDDELVEELECVKQPSVGKP